MYPFVANVSTYSVVLALAVLVGTAVSIGIASRRGVLNANVAWGLALVALFSVLGAKFHGVIERGGNFGTFSAELSAGYRYQGGVLGAGLGVLLLRGRLGGLSPLALADVMTPGIGVAMAFVRIGCLLNGCCSGKVCSLPWAITFPANSQVFNTHLRHGILESSAASSLAVHPLQAYFGLYSLSLAALSLWLLDRKRFDGQVFLVYLTAAGLGKFVLESFRFTTIPVVQQAALVVGVLGLVTLVAIRARSAR